MSISIAQQTGAASFVTAASKAVAFGSNNTLGNALVACGFMNDIAGLGAFTDSQGNTWHTTGVQRAANAFMYLGYALNCKAGANTVTLSTNHGSVAIGMPCIAEISGVDTASSVLSGTSTSSTSWSTPSISVPFSAAFVFGSYSWSMNTTVTLSSPFSNLGVALAGSNFDAGCYDIISSSASYQASGTLLVGSNWNGMIMYLYKKSLASNQLMTVGCGA